MEVLEAGPYMNDGSSERAEVEYVVRVSEEIIAAYLIFLRNFLGVQDRTNDVELTTAKERPQRPLVNLSLFHEVCRMEAARLG